MGTLNKVNELISHIEKKSLAVYAKAELLFDPNSFVEVGAFNKDASVVTGYGIINNKLVYAYFQDGVVSVEHAKKIAEIYDLAIKMGAPVVGVMDSDGLKLEEGIDAFEAYGILLSNQSHASGVVPQISIVTGKCIGMSSFIPTLSDFVFMTTKGKLFMNSPSTFEGIEGKSTSYDDLGGFKANASKSGISHFSYDDEKKCFNDVRKLIDFFPSNNLEEPRYKSLDDLNREDAFLNTVVPDDPNSQIDMHSIITAIADNNEFLEVHKYFASNIIAGFIKLNGCTIGVVANNGLINIDATQKAGNLVNICDAFNIPILTLTDTVGYEKSVEQEYKGIVKYGAKLIFTFANATVPKLNVIIRNAIGNSYLLMNSKHIGADIVYAWPTAEISLMDKRSMMDIMKISAKDYNLSSNPYSVAGKGYIDDIIVPAHTRKRIISAFEMLSSKREIHAAKKHSSIEF